ncbi:MAG TPA: endolytic transglycosylase MltG [Candidatus Saccharimonadales bacterium]|nr:endolytic transglycosylase MltG [Candidatus Saccharimonadales bacterium]
MANYRLRKTGRRMPKKLIVLVIILLVLVIGGMVAVQRVYLSNLQPVGSQPIRQYVTIISGSSVNEIADQLHNLGLIRSSQAFEWYISSHNYRDKLQAGTYSIAKNESVPQIVDKLVNGKVATDLVTILPGKRIDEIRQTFITAGFAPTAVDAAFKAGQYRGEYPALADNPPSADLEGFLYPDSFQKTSTTDPKAIVALSLTEMQKHLTTNIRNGFAKQGLSVYQGVTLASMVEQEVSKQDERAQAAQVFLTRLHKDMPLGSDVTARYGAIRAGMTPSLTYDSPYNTLLHKGLPPGPISNVSDSSLEAVAHPAKTSWLYFVTGDNGVTHFSKTLEEHKALTAKYCHKLCGE